jgi:hypothetical protein
MSDPLNFDKLITAVLSPIAEQDERAKAFVEMVEQRYKLDGVGRWWREYFAIDVAQLLSAHEFAILRRNAPPRHSEEP